MIVPMKKVSLLVLEPKKVEALKTLRRLGLMHLEEVQGVGGSVQELKDLLARLEQGLFAVSERQEKGLVQKQVEKAEALDIAASITALLEEQKNCHAKISAYQGELERLKPWGEVDPQALAALTENGVHLVPCEMSLGEYQKLEKEIVTLPLNRDKTTIRFLCIGTGTQEDALVAAYRLRLPQTSTTQMRSDIAALQQQLQDIDTKLNGYAAYAESLKKAIAAVKKDLELETYATGMAQTSINGQEEEIRIAHLQGYIPAEDVGQLKAAAKENAWGLAMSDPDEEDNVPTKLRNNKIVSIIYPLTDFLGTVPGYFEYDISGWFLAFMLIFFGIIFGDGGYGLLICGVAAALMGKDRAAKRPIAPICWLIMALGGATVVWGLLTCSWFGLPMESLPQWLKGLSLPVISNVNADRLWYPFWTNGEAGLTTAQNLQILCFSLALIQLTVAHIKSIIGNRGSLKILGDVGTILQLWGMFYVVLTLVVNGEVFGLGRVISGVPVGTLSIALVGVGFAISFVFGSYEGSIKESILDSLKNIVSVFLGVVNIFSDIVSYIRLWAVGLAGAAISATVNEMAGPMLGKLVFVIFAVILLVFGHGLNMILNVLSVIVHGVRLNTLEFSSHLGMNWSGHKFDPFKE